MIKRYRMDLVTWQGVAGGFVVAPIEDPEGDLVYWTDVKYLIGNGNENKRSDANLQ